MNKLEMINELVESRFGREVRYCKNPVDSRINLPQYRNCKYFLENILTWNIVEAFKTQKELIEFLKNY